MFFSWTVILFYGYNDTGNFLLSTFLIESFYLLEIETDSKFIIKSLFFWPGLVSLTVKHSFNVYICFFFNYFVRNR